MTAFFDKCGAPAQPALTPDSARPGPAGKVNHYLSGRYEQMELSMRSLHESLHRVERKLDGVHDSVVESIEKRIHAWKEVCAAQPHEDAKEPISSEAGALASNPIPDSKGVAQTIETETSVLQECRPPTESVEAADVAARRQEDPPRDIHGFVKETYEDRQKVIDLRRIQKELEAERIQKETSQDNIKEQISENGRSKGLLRQVHEVIDDYTRVSVQGIYMDCSSLKAIVDGVLNWVILVVLIFNSILLALEAECLGREAEQSLGVSLPGCNLQNLFRNSDFALVAIYSFEFVLRVIVFRLGFVYDVITGIQWGNILDVVFLLCQILALLLEVPWGEVVVLAKSIKWLRLARVWRVVRVLTVFRPLRFMVKTFLASLGSLVWCMVMLFLVMGMTAIMFVFAVSEFIIDESNDLQTREWVNGRYGSFSKAMYTMFELTLSGGWPNYARPMVEKVSVWYAAAFMFYVLLIVFAFLRIAGALFIKETFQVTSNDAAYAVQEKLRATTAYKARLMEIFKCTDTSADKELSRAEFNAALQDTAVVQYLAVLDIDVHEADFLFDLLDDGDGKVSIEEFCNGIPRVRGVARALDVVSLLHNSNIIMQQAREIRQLVSHQRGIPELSCSLGVSPPEALRNKKEQAQQLAHQALGSTRSLLGLGLASHGSTRSSEDFASIRT